MKTRDARQGYEGYSIPLNSGPIDTAVYAKHIGPGQQRPGYRRGRRIKILGGNTIRTGIHNPQPGGVGTHLK
jgi:hypothetical protein